MRTSSNREGRIFRTRSPSENRGRTLANPFINEIFSSLDLVAKVDRSRKLRVDMGKEEKKACEGRSVGDGRLCACRVMSELNNAWRTV